MKYCISDRMAHYTGRDGWDAPTLDAATPAELRAFFGPLADVHGALANLGDLTEGGYIRFHMMRAASAAEFEAYAVRFAVRAGAYWDPRYADTEIARVVRDCRTAIDRFNAAKGTTATAIRRSLEGDFHKDRKSPRAQAPIVGRGWQR